jgi:menaquinone-dependent protoporphyrinogen IX oxidase
VNIGVIYFSQTGNTHSVAMKVKEKLIEQGHTVGIERLKVIGDFKPRQKNIQFEALPDIEQYDGIVFAAPVQAFSLCQPMTRYLEQVPSLKEKKVALYVTKHMRFNWTGGNQAINKMKKMCRAKEADLGETGIIVWSSDEREQMINDVVAKISQFF